MADVRPIPAILDDDRPALVGVLAQNLARVGAKTAALLWVGLFLGDQSDGAIETDGEDVVAFLQVCVDLAVFDVRAETSDAGDDRLAVFGRQSDFARQRQQTERFLQVNIVGRHTFWNSGALGLFDFGFFLAPLRFRRLDLLAELQIGPVAAPAQGHLKPGVRILTQDLLALNAVGARRDLSREIAFRIVRAADESAKAAGLQRELADLALRALPARLAIRPLWKNMRLEQIVERIEHDAIAHFLDLVDGADELRPEFGEHGAPVDVARRNLVELFFEARGEIVFDVVCEEALEKRDDDATFVFGNEALLVDANIAAILQHLKNRGIGGGPADAELFHALDERCF